MSVLHLPNAHYKSLVSAHEDVLLGDQISWLNGLRKKAADQFSEIGFPSFREEEWRYTNVTPIEKNKFTSEKIVNLGIVFFLNRWDPPPPPVKKFFPIAAVSQKPTFS